MFNRKTNFLIWKSFRKAMENDEICDKKFVNVAYKKLNHRLDFFAGNIILKFNWVKN